MASWKNHIRIVTAASLFDGHDASINMIRRLLQDAGGEVIHLGHNRSVMDIVTAALQEGAQGICISSYQGGHVEFFKYMKDLLREFGAPYVKVFGGGGGVIVHDEKRDLENYGIDQIFHPDDGRRLGLEGMINMILERSDFDINTEAAKVSIAGLKPKLVSQSIFNERLRDRQLGLALSAVELQAKNTMDFTQDPFLSSQKNGRSVQSIILGITGTGGAGKSSLVDELTGRFLNWLPEVQVGILCVDPTKRKTGGALLGDRIRMNSLSRPKTYMRSIASRGSGNEISKRLPDLVATTQKAALFDLLIVETSGIGQADSAITEISNLSLYVMTSEFGAQSQLEKIDMIDFADLIAINKADRRGSLDALRDVRKQYRRSHKLFHEGEDKDLPVFLTQASQFNDEGINLLFSRLCQKLTEKSESKKFQLSESDLKNMIHQRKTHLIPPDRQNYLAQIVGSVRKYKKETQEKAKIFSQLGALQKAQELVEGLDDKVLEKTRLKLNSFVTAEDTETLKQYEVLQSQYQQKELSYGIRGKEIRQSLVVQSLSGSTIRRVSLPQLTDWGDRFRYMRLENVPGQFPYTAGVFPLKRVEEEPKRQFAGEGSPERTNKRFHYLSKNDPAKRLSTAFDSVTLYGEDPDLRPDIYGKVGESGVSICSLNDMKTLYSGFDLINPSTSVSMTINGPAPIILAFFLNTAIDQQVEKKEKEVKRTLNPAELAEIESSTLQQVRGTVQADILKEDQAQNTCIFSTDFALKMMGDIQQYFIDQKVRNFYSVSISGYHIAEAGANPISQLAFTLSNGFTYVEYYLARGMKIDDFAPNLSFFFSNGLDPEYSVLGRVARRIWAVALRDLYGASDRSQKLKYHIQTSGRSLHAQEIDFNDIRTTLQALIAIYDHCNSLHTNAYDEAITTPTEESVRRAMAIQMIINREFGVTKNENPMQGSFFTDELTELVEEAVLEEFLRISERGGVLGAMEMQYQRSKIQDESLLYERLKHSGELPLIGVNTFIDPKTVAAGYEPPRIEMARASSEEKKLQLDRLKKYQVDQASVAHKELEALKLAALSGKNIFAQLMKCARVCSLGQMSQVLYDVGGRYRRSI